MGPMHVLQCIRQNGQNSFHPRPLLICVAAPLSNPVAYGQFNVWCQGIETTMSKNIPLKSIQLNNMRTCEIKCSRTYINLGLG